MGYTHYFEHREVSQEVWDKIVKDCRSACKTQAATTPLERNYEDSREPIFDDNSIFFNGVGDDGHETFVLELQGSGGFTFCKTARKPYDLLVCACLIIYKHYSPDTMDLSSDGFNKDRPEDQEWVDARQLVNDVLGY